jgi:hypothetical protein
MLDGAALSRLGSRARANGVAYILWWGKPRRGLVVTILNVVWADLTVPVSESYCLTVCTVSLSGGWDHGARAAPCGYLSIDRVWINNDRLEMRH